MSEPHRGALNALLDGLHGELVSAVAESTGLGEARTIELIETGPHTARQAQEAGLIEAVSYTDEARSALDEALGEDDVPRLQLGDYLQARRDERGPHVVAVVHCVGTILPGRSTESLFGGTTAGSDTIAEAIRSAWEDDGADAIVLRIDSPGGSPVAADAIWRAVARAQEADVPVIASMSDVAASGGYWIAAGADHVVAVPATITGSIGIYGGKYVTNGLNDLVGMNVEAIDRGANAGINSSLEPFNESQRAWLKAQLSEIYGLFLEKTANGRGFETIEDVHEHARGHVWTGRQALELGLVDELGGMREALAAARRLGDIPEREPFQLRQYPRPPGLFDGLKNDGFMATVGAGVRRQVAREALAELPDGLAHWATVGRIAQQLQHEGVVAYWPYQVLAE